MDYFRGATGIRSLCCFGLLWAIILVDRPLWHLTACIGCYGHELINSSSIRKKQAHVVHLDDPNIWAECLQNQDQFFKRTMPIAIKNLSIAQHHEKLRYARICTGA
jgi:hypothetical protein